MSSQANFNLDFTINEPENVEVGPEGGTNPNNGKVIENLVLASIHCWMQKGTRDVVHNTAKKGFLLEEIRAAAEHLLTEVGQHFTNRRGSANRTKTDLLLDDILGCLYTLDDKGHLPKITVNSMDLVRMPVVTACDGDSIGVSFCSHWSHACMVERTQ